LHFFVGGECQANPVAIFWLKLVVIGVPRPLDLGTFLSLCQVEDMVEKVEVMYWFGSRMTTEGLSASSITWAERGAMIMIKTGAIGLLNGGADA
jgi:hypothetical protein